MKLGEIAEISVGFPFQSEKFNIDGTGIRLVRGKNVTKRELRWGEDTRWWNEPSESLEKYLLKDGDIVIGMYGSLVGKNFARISSSDLPLYLVQRVACIRAKEGISQEFLWQCIASCYFSNYVESIKTGSAIPHISGGQISNFEIPDIDFISATKIGEILGTIDKKIATNIQINRNLSEQLDLLYDDWFGKYKPFNLGIGGDPNYDLDEGWHVEDIYSVANIIYGAPFASKLFNTDGDGKPIVRIRDLKNQELCTFTTENHPRGYMIQAGDIVVGMDGEFRPYIWGNEEAWLNQRVCVFDNVRENGKAFIYCTIKPLLHSVEATEVATTVIHIGKRDFDEFRVVLPPENIMVEFEAISKPMYDQIVEGQLENRRLAQLRDSLLPKLMSGELDVSDFDI